MERSFSGAFNKRKLVPVFSCLGVSCTSFRIPSSAAVFTFIVDPSRASERVASGEAVLVDVREPNEWEEGVAEPAHLLTLSDLRGARKDWKGFLENLSDGHEVILYYRTGNRSGIYGEILAKEGISMRNAGGFRDWKSAGLPVRKPAPSDKE